MKVHYPKLHYSMAHLLALNALLLPKDITIIFILVDWGRSFLYVAWPTGF